MVVKIAIIGNQILNSGPIPPGYTKWGFNRQIKEADYWFDIHRKTCEHLTDKSDYGKFIKEKGNKAFLSFDNPNFPKAEHFPWEQLVYKHGALFTNSVDWLMAYAITLKPKVILLYGITIHPEDNHAFCRPGNEYFIGFARGQGIEVIIPSTSWLCRPEYITPEYYIGLDHGRGIYVSEDALEQTVLFKNKQLYGIEN